MLIRLIATAAAALVGLSLVASSASAARSAQAKCLALAMYWEAKNEGEQGMTAVASVVLNRVANPGFPATVCAVVKQGGESPPCQFSWWCDGKSDRPVDARAWATASRIAERAIFEPPPDATRGALFFHNTGIAIPWKRDRQRTVKIGRHIFYR